VKLTARDARVWQICGFAAAAPTVDSSIAPAKFESSRARFDPKNRTFFSFYRNIAERLLAWKGIKTGYKRDFFRKMKL
jgi:hypothetical protein